MLKLVRSKIAALAIILFAGPAMAGDALNVRNCTWCHGTSGEGFANAPRLAGQREQYIWDQLVNFVNHTRDNPFSRQYMWPAVAALNPLSARNLAFYFSTVPPEPAADGKKALVLIGGTLYAEGSPETNLVPCAGCHGPNAEGIGAIPRLGGLSYRYLKRRLEEWVEGYHPAARPPMPGIANKLYPNEIEALASYLSFVQ
jgi:cytochrome c553